MKPNDIIEIAKAEIGYIGKKSNKDLYDKTANITGKYTKYAQELFENKYYNGNKNGWNWCCCFTDWCFLKAAGSKEEADKVKPYSIYNASCTWTKKAFEKVGRISKNPALGAQVFFLDKAGDVAHTGLVVGVSDNEITTVEGNTSNKVELKTYVKTNPIIDSYGLPFYDEDTPEPEPEWETILEFTDVDGKLCRIQRQKA